VLKKSRFLPAVGSRGYGNVQPRRERLSDVVLRVLILRQRLPLFHGALFQPPVNLNQALRRLSVRHVQLELLRQAAVDGEERERVSSR
jgi:hypothetical protein